MEIFPKITFCNSSNLFVEADNEVLTYKQKLSHKHCRLQSWENIRVYKEIYTKWNQPLNVHLVVSGKAGKGYHRGCHGRGPVGEVLMVQKCEQGQVLGQILHFVVCFCSLQIEPEELENE